MMAEIEGKIKIFEYNKECSTFTVVLGNSFITEIPIYIGKLGIKLPNFFFNIPGESSNTQNDYYVAIDRNEKIYEFNNMAVKLVLDKDFDLTGKYYLIPVDRDLAVIPRTATLKSKEEIDDICSFLCDSIVEGSVIHGNVVAIMSDSIILEHPKDDSIILIQDPITRVEFLVPQKFVRLLS